MFNRSVIFHLIAASVLLLAAVSSALAHEGVEAGEHDITIGWVNEPPLLGEPNTVYLHITERHSGEPVDNVAGLTLAVQTGSQSRELTLRALDNPGEFGADFIPTVRGEYTIKLSGQLEGEPVNVTQHVEMVEPAQPYQFPAAVSTAPELTEQLVRLQAQNQELQAAVSFNRWLSLGALLAGLLGVGVALLARKSAPAAEPARRAVGKSKTAVS